MHCNTAVVIKEEYFNLQSYPAMYISVGVTSCFPSREGTATSKHNYQIPTTHTFSSGGMVFKYIKFGRYVSSLVIYRIALIFCGSKFSQIVVLKEFVEKFRGCVLPMCLKVQWLEF